MSAPYAKMKSRKQKLGNKMKSLKITSVGPYGEIESFHNVGESMSEEMYVVAILKGVTKAGNAIKSFELVEA
jgi:hypothetical protein